MNEEPSIGFTWVREIPTLVKELDRIPLTGYPPEFPWKKLIVNLQTIFERKDLQLQSTEWQWREEKDLFSGLGDRLFPLCFTASPIEGHFFWALSEQNLTLLMALLLAHETHPFSLVDPAFEEGFYEFVALEVLHVIKNIDFDPSLTFQLLDIKELPKDPCLSSDISISLQETMISGRLFLPHIFLENWRKHYLQRKESASSSFASKIEIPVSINAGTTRLSQKEWKDVKDGDFIILETCTIQPDNGEGTVQFTVNGKPHLQGRLKEGNITIQESPLQHLGEVDMAKEINQEKTPEEEHSFDEEEFTEFEETEDEDLEDLTEDELTEEEFEDDELGEEFTEGENDIAPTEMETKKEISKETSPKKEEKPHQEQKVDIKQKAPSGSFAPFEEIPVSLTIEVARLQMSIKEITDLKPGNLLELNVHPESGVYLSINGKIVGKGEILRIGETLGVRILEKG